MSPPTEAEEVERLRSCAHKLTACATKQMSDLTAKVKAELGRYEHPLFKFDARPNGDGVEVEIRFKPKDADVHVYTFQMHPREIEHAQFPWTFQRQLYDCLHDYVIEMFTRNPQRQD